ncbi:MAG TPA: type IX secretion system plug protein domain-containing protein [Bacteroidia bacterium]|nr:type IX secretion system plug protein domain-containing protein [Bacteroidia bacterium]
MTRRLYFILSPVLLFFALPLRSNAQQQDEYFSEGYMRYENMIYKSNIKTVIFEKYGVQFSDPVITLGSGEQLFLSFDDLDGDFKSYAYTLIHCDASWHPTNLMPNEFLEGFYEEHIDNYETSFNTIQKYTHYMLTLPGRDVRPMISGNYLLKIFVEGQNDHPVITRRMMVLEPLVVVDAKVNRGTITDTRETCHEIDFAIHYPAIKVANPFEDVKVVLRQNNRWDNAIFGLKPLFLKDNLLEYDYEEGNIFKAGNEFRNFDATSLRLQSIYVKNIVEADNGFTVVLMPEISRAFDRYVFENDIDGNRLIRNQHVNNSDIEAEYVSVKFTLKHELLANGNFYVFGALSDWRTSKEFMMNYNPDENAYEALLYLKQGYYNYEYVFVADGKHVCDDTLVEGSHYETENNYSILVYYRPLGGRYDKLVNYTKMNSKF